jgi:hypothetical protein
MTEATVSTSAHASPRIDLVGDIHGASARLLRLLAKLGYAKSGGRWTHSDGARLVFLGDYADKGDDVEGGIELVRELCDHRVACAIAGNHDTNALAFCMRRDTWNFDALGARTSAHAMRSGEADLGSGWVRRHSRKNIKQHCRTLGLEANSYDETIAWFATLPLWLELPGLRAVHAAWIPPSIRKIRSLAAREGSDEIDTSRTDIAWLEARSIDEAIELQHARQRRGGITTQDWRLLLDLRSERDERTTAVTLVGHDINVDRSTPDRSHAVALERVLKGVECPLGDVTFRDAEGSERKQVRIRWFDAAADRTVVDHALVPTELRQILSAQCPSHTFSGIADSLARESAHTPPLDTLIPFHARDAYGADERPVFFGHYGFKPEEGCILLRNNVACLDTSAYDDEHGALTAYSWRGERALDGASVTTVL